MVPATIGPMLSTCGLRPAAEQLGPQLASLLAPPDAARVEARRAEFAQPGVPEEMVRRAATALPVVATLDVAEIGAATGCPLERVARVHFALDVQLHFGWVREQAAQLAADTHWQALARTALLGELAGLVPVARVGVRVDQRRIDTGDQVRELLHALVEGLDLFPELLRRPGG